MFHFRSSTQTRMEKEAVRHNDILQFGVMDGYYKLSAKAAAFLDWINNNCNTLDFVLKVDDDVFVNVRNLATILKDLSPFENKKPKRNRYLICCVINFENCG